MLINRGKGNLGLKVVTCGISDIGLVRQNNEDVWSELPEQRCYILADGMGGHQAGEIAARETVKALARHLQRVFKNKKHTLAEAILSIKRAILRTNSHVYKLGRSFAELKGMGTTLCVLHLHNGGVIYAHVGDSRIYRLRGGVLQQLTKDHSLLRELKERGHITDDQIGDFHYKNIITRAIGTEPEVEPSINQDEAYPDDIYLLCSDGLSDLLSFSEIEQTLKETRAISEAALNLVSLSKMRGGHDNVTVLIVAMV
jgi:protein phosphatase